MMDPAQLFAILEGNRRLTIRVVEAFPEQELFGYAPAEPLRPFADMIKEILGIEDAYVRGAATGEWTYAPKHGGVTTKAELLAACEEVRGETRALWERVTAERLRTEEKDGFFGDFSQSNFDRFQYALENEIHHRGQGYTYLRMLGIEPPAFYER